MEKILNEKFQEVFGGKLDEREIVMKNLQIKIAEHIRRNSPFRIKRRGRQNIKV